MVWLWGIRDGSPLGGREVLEELPSEAQGVLWSWLFPWPCSALLGAPKKVVHMVLT